MLEVVSDILDIQVSDSENLDNKRGSVKLKGKNGKYIPSHVLTLKILSELDGTINSFEK